MYTTVLPGFQPDGKNTATKTKVAAPGNLLFL